MSDFRLLAPSRTDERNPLATVLGFIAIAAGYVGIAHAILREIELYLTGFDWRAFWGFVAFGGVLVFGVGR